MRNHLGTTKLWYSYTVSIDNSNTIITQTKTTQVTKKTKGKVIKTKQQERTTKGKPIVKKVTTTEKTYVAKRKQNEVNKYEHVTTKHIRHCQLTLNNELNQLGTTQKPHNTIRLNMLQLDSTQLNMI